MLSVTKMPIVQIAIMVRNSGSETAVTTRNHAVVTDGTT